eukprot:TRINITY_DN2278_c0_g1_i9.p1 TRINITY_DN2278_c0_g1~~TRINITY_DN2278_c0_g1_i9.p1  ORF type:complete len:151 (+),score=10.14 TRINITY_DN2278_c0_g1_i9:230-682(+)
MVSMLHSHGSMSGRRVHRIRKRAQRAAVCAAAVVSLMYCRRSARSGTRGACYRRRRLDWTLRTRQLRQGLREERQFVSRYGLDSEGFAEVCNRCCPSLRGSLTPNSSFIKALVMSTARMPSSSAKRALCAMSASVGVGAASCEVLSLIHI